MAVTGKFLADFASFYTAVQKADVELLGLESSSAKVEKSVNRLANSFSGTKIIQDAHLVAEAVQRIGGAAQLTESEQKKVNATVTEAIAKYTALGQVAPKTLTDLANATQQAQKTSSGWFSSLTSEAGAMAAGMISAQAVIGGVRTAIGALTDFVMGSIDSFASAEAAEKKMTVALQSMGRATPEAVSQMNDLAASFQQTTVYSDDLINEMEALLIQVGQVAPGEMNKALTAATDLASGLGIDLESATMLVAKAFAGNTDTLGRYGIVLDQTKLKAEGITAVLDAVQAKFGGQAAAELDTYSGQLKKLANDWDNVKEGIGEVIVSSPILTALLRELQAAIVNVNTGVVDLTHGFSNLYERIGNPLGLAGGIRLLEDWAISANDAAKAAENLAKWNPKDLAPMASHTPVAEQDAARERKAREDQKKADEAAAKAKAAADKAAAEQAKQYAASVKALHDELYGANAIAAAQKYAAAIQSTGDIAKMSADQQKQINAVMGEALREYRELGKAAPKAWRDIYDATLDATNVLAKTPEVVRGVGTALSNLEAIGQKTFASFPKVIDGFNASLLSTASKVDLIPPKLKTVTFDIGDLSKSLTELATVAGGAFGKVASGLATITTGAKAAKEAVAQIKDGAADIGKGGTFAGILEMTSGITGLISVGMTAFNIVKKLFSFFGDEGRDMVEDFAKGQGGFDALHEKLLALGDAGEALWIKLTQGVGRNNPDEAAAAIAEVEAALAKQAAQTDDVTAATEEQAQATIETATQAALALAELGPKLKANEDEWRAWGDLVTAQLQAVADQVRAIPLPTLSPGSASTILGNSAKAAESDPGEGSYETKIYLDGDVLARSNAKRMPRVLSGVGV